ncbi:MAG: glycosyltransferase [Candidatus Nanohaloarchaea archaeon]
MNSELDNTVMLSDLTDGSVQFFTDKLCEAARIHQEEVPGTRAPFFQINIRLHWTIPRLVKKLEKEYSSILFPSHTLLSGVNPERYEADIIPIVHDLEWVLNFEGNFIENYNIKKSIENVKKCDKVIAISEVTKDDLVNEIGVEEGKIHVVRQGVDTDRVYKDTSKPESVDLPDDYILYLGGLQTRKNPEFLIDVLSELPEEYQLVIAGRKYDEENRERLEKCIREKGEEERVTFTGFLPLEDLRRVYSNASVYLHSAFFEGYGRTPVEAATCGTIPILCENLPCVEDLQDVAITYSEFDSKAVARKVEENKDFDVSFEPRSWSQASTDLQRTLEAN